MYTLNPKYMAPLEGMPLQKRLYTSAKLAGVMKQESSVETARINLNALEDIVRKQGKAIYMKALVWSGADDDHLASAVMLTAPDSSKYKQNWAACVNSTNNMCLFPMQVLRPEQVDPNPSGVRCPIFKVMEPRQRAGCLQVAMPAKSILQLNHLLFYHRRRKPGTSLPKPFS